MSANAPMSAPTQSPIGLVTIGKTTYTVHRLPVGENTAKAGVRNQFGLTGPRGATYMVIDHGPKYQLKTIACGGGRGGMICSPRQLTGATRAHFAAFGVEG